MSFSSDIKRELLSYNYTGRHCLTAALAAVININGYVGKRENSHRFIIIHNDNPSLLEKTVDIIDELFGRRVPIGMGNNIVIEDQGLISEILRITGVKDSTDFSVDSPIDFYVVSKNCCKRAYIRTAFLCCGSISDPHKHYHIEFVDNDYEHADSLKQLIASFGISMKIVERKNHFVVYCKEAELIVDLLNVMSAHRALLELENLRVVKGVRNNVNRLVNCETANLNKVIAASVRQIEAIEYISDKKGLGCLPDNLKKMAEIRIMYPDASLKELGEKMIPPVGKSGVNHRLKKICEIADKLKGDNNYG